MSKIKCVNRFKRQTMSFLTGFSLVEMLMTLLVASLLLAALAPVMTRRFNENVNVSGNGKTIKNPEGYQCYPYNDSLNTVDVQLKDVYYANFIIASGGGGGAGATSVMTSNAVTVTKTTNEIKTNAKEYDEQIIPITEYMTNVKLESLVGAGGGGGGGAGSIMDCAAYGTGKTDTVGNTGANFATSDLNGLCVTKFNQKTSSNCWNNYTNNATCTNNKNNIGTTGPAYEYSGCSRWVCIHASAITACNDLAKKTGDNWRLPTPNEIGKWNNANIWKVLHLCDFYTGTVVSRYQGSTNLVTSSNYANPHAVHSSDIMSAYQLGQSTWMKGYGSNSSTVAQWPFSTRCVLDEQKKLFSGSAGGSASSLSNMDLSQYVKQAGIDGQIVLRTGRAGKGGAGAPNKNISASNGEEGYKSCVYIQKKNGASTIYALCAYGGKGGNGATANSLGGANGTMPASYSYCREYMNNNWKDISCNMITSGNYGKGGTGGSAQYKNDAIITSSGLAGTGGFIKLTYNNEYAAAGGGGGGGGSVAKILNMYVGKEATCTLSIGKGGKGGNIDNNGEDGGLSSVKCDSDARTFMVNGGKGGKKGTAAQNQTTNPTPGTKGTFGDANTYIYSIDPDKREIKKGLDGKDGSYNQTLKQSIGGRGGTSGTGTKGACGGLYEEENICKVDATASDRHIGKGFTYEDIITPNSQDVQNSIYGTASAGGGGGAWTRTTNSGKGGNGLPGYVCVYWFNDNE